MFAKPKRAEAALAYKLSGTGFRCALPSGGGGGGGRGNLEGNSRDIRARGAVVAGSRVRDGWAAGMGEASAA